MKLCLGCGPQPFHPMHLSVITDPTEWLFIDKYVSEPGIFQWDAQELKEVEDGTVSHIYASHLLEHFPHTQTPALLGHWFDKLEPGGKVTINVPDMAWMAAEVLKYDRGQELSGYYHGWEGEHGLQQVLYGSHAHEGEVHKAGFCERSLYTLLHDCGFKDITIERALEAHQMGVLIAEGVKP